MYRFTLLDAKQIGAQLCIDWHKVDLHEFLRGLNVELEHGRADPETNVTCDDPILTGKIALAHLRELPDYYTRLARIEDEAVEPVDAIC
jgi:hypothetical protein